MFPRKLSGFGAAVRFSVFVPLREILLAYIRVHSRLLFVAWRADLSAIVPRPRDDGGRLCEGGSIRVHSRLFFAFFVLFCGY